MTRTDTKYKDSPRRYSNESPKNYLKPWEKSKAQQNAEKDKAVSEYKGKITKLPPGKAKLKEENEITEDFEYEMARNELATADRAIKRLMEKLSGEGNLEAWVQSKITKASDYLDSVADYMESGKVNEEVELDEGRGRPPKPGSAAYKRKHGDSGSETSDDTAHQGRDPQIGRAHV